MLVSRPNLAVAICTFTVGLLSHYVADLGREHRDSVQVIMQYLQGTTDRCMSSGSRHDNAADSMFDHLRVEPFAQDHREPMGVG